MNSTRFCLDPLLGASGGVELVASALAIHRGVLPPTINLDDPGEGCDLDYIPNEARESDIQVGVSNSFGFGGHNACVVFRKHDE